MQTATIANRIRIFGIRHHGPGSARSLVAALEDWRPEILLVEGPSEAGSLVPFLLDEFLTTPVAMLLYNVETPSQAIYYPLADFSPELQAFRWAGRNGVDIRFLDLPAGAQLGFSTPNGSRSDVLDDVAKASGFEDTEEWWEHLVERRADPAELFAGIEELITALRAGQIEATVPEEPDEPEVDDGKRRVSAAEFEAIREAHMRKGVRQALSEGFERIAVVCGAWHVPALRNLPTEKSDNERLKGLPKIKVGATVAPWTFDRLTFGSGYGAGAPSPAYYDLVFNTPPAGVSVAWLLAVARLMRREDLEASPAGVIEAVRLADALASLRGRPRPGLRELREAASSVLIRDAAIWSLISRRLIVGERMGVVPDGVPVIPLQSDLAALQKRLKLPIEDSDRKIELDLRSEFDLQRSHLLYRLDLLGVYWGAREQAGGKKGTFHEHWRIRWQPELTIHLIEAAVYGNTVVQASSNCAVHRATQCRTLAEIARLVDQVLTADLPEAIGQAVSRLEAIAATQSDVADLADSLPPLIAIVRYGTVRRTEAEKVVPVLDAIFTRLCVGLPAACISLDDETAGVMSKRLGAINEVVGLLVDSEGGVEKRSLWLDALSSIATIHGAHLLVVGKAERLRFDLGSVDGEYLGVRLSQAASSGAAARECAAFVEGLLDGSGSILIHHDALFHAVDDWIVGLDVTVFDEILPLIRRSFSLFSKPERRQIGERVADRRVFASQQTTFNEERALRIMPKLRLILGLKDE